MKSGRCRNDLDLRLKKRSNQSLKRIAASYRLPADFLPKLSESVAASASLLKAICRE